MSKVVKVGGKVGKKVGGTVQKKFKKKPGPGPARIGDDLTKKGQKKKQGLQVHYTIKVRRVTQIAPEYNEKEVHVLYSNGKDHHRSRVPTSNLPVSNRIAILPKEEPPYEFDVILRPWEEEVEEDEVPWKPHPVMFSLRTEREMTEEELQELRDKLEKKQEKNKKKNKRKAEELEEDPEDPGEAELEELIKNKTKIDIIGTKAQLDLSQYAEDGCNITEAFGVPNPRKKKKKKKKKKKTDEEPIEEEPEEEIEEPLTMAFKMVVNIQAKFVKFKGRMISKDLEQDGDRVMIGHEEWVYTEPPIPSDDEESFDEDDPLGIGLTEEEIQQLEPKVRDKLMKDIKKKEKLQMKKQQELDRAEEKERKIEEKEREKLLARQQQLAKEEEKRRNNQQKEQNQKKTEAELKAAQLESETQRELEEREKQFDLEVGKELEREKQEAKQLEKERLRREKEEKRSSSKKSKKRGSTIATPKTKHKRSTSSSSNESEISTETLKQTNTSRKPKTTSNIPLPTGGPRVKVKTTVSIKFKELRGFSSRREGKMIYISWRRGIKKENSGETTRAFCEKKKVDLADSSSISFPCQFSHAAKQDYYEEKVFSFAVKDDGVKKSIGDGSFNLSEHLPISSQEPVSKVIEIPVHTSSKSEKLVLELEVNITRGISMSAPSSLKLASKPSEVSSSKKGHAKILFFVQPLKLDKIKTNESYLLLKWNRGAKKSNHGKTGVIPTSQPFWTDEEPPFRINCTMAKKSNGKFHTKNLTLELLATGSSDAAKTKSLGKATINLADYATHDFQQQTMITLQHKKSVVGLLSIEIRAQMTQYEGKRLHKAPKDLSRVDAGRVVQMDGQDFVVETAEDCSEMSEISDESIADGDEDDSESIDNNETFKPDEPEVKNSHKIKSSGSSKTSKIMKALHMPSSKKETSAPIVNVTNESKKGSKTKGKKEERPKKEVAVAPIVTTESREVDSDTIEKLEASQKEVVALESKLLTLQEQKKEADEELSQLRENVSDSDRIASLNEKLTRLKQQDKEKTLLISTQEEKLANATSTSETLQKHKELLEQKLQKAVEAIAIAQKQLTSLSNEAKRLQTENQEKLKEIESYEAKLKELQQNASKALKKHGGEKAQHLTEVFEQQLTLVRTQSQQNKKLADDARQQCKEKEREVAELKQQLLVAEENVSSVKSGSNEDGEFFERVQCLRRNLLFAPRDFDLETRAPICVDELTSYYMQHQEDMDVILELFQMIGLMARNAGKDLYSICYWLSVTTGLCSSLEEEGIYSGDIRTEGITAPTKQFQTIDQITSSSQLEVAMKLFSYDIYNIMVTQIYDELDSFLEESFINGGELVFDQKVKFTDPHRSVEVTIRVLAKVLDAFLSNYCTPVIIHQCFSQLVYYISASLFNRVISTPAYCSPRIGLQIKMSVSHLISWLHQKTAELPLLEDTIAHMNHVVEISNVLTLATNENVFQEEFLAATFPSLNLAQLRKVIELYSPDKYAPEPVPVQVKRFIQGACQRDPNVRSLPLDLEPILPLHSISAGVPDTKSFRADDEVSEESEEESEEYSFD